MSSHFTLFEKLGLRLGNLILKIFDKENKIFYKDYNKL